MTTENRKRCAQELVNLFGPIKSDTTEWRMKFDDDVKTVESVIARFDEMATDEEARCRAVTARGRICNQTRFNDDHVQREKCKNAPCDLEHHEFVAAEKG